MRRFDRTSFLFKHWALNHPDLLEAPKFEFSGIKTHKDALSRMVHEAVLIGDNSTMNSKSEFGGYKIARLSVSQSDWQKKKI